MMKNYKGKILMYDMMGYATILLGLLIILLLGVATSNSERGNWGNMVLYILLYFIFVPIIYKVSQCFQNKYLRQAHFVLSVVCRAENNRYYLKRGVEVRPGYLARWVEFDTLDMSDGKDPLMILQDRHKKETESAQKNMDKDHQKFMLPFNRDFTIQAIDLRIQIEQTKLERELTYDEQQDIIDDILKREGVSNATGEINPNNYRDLKKNKPLATRGNAPAAAQESSSEYSSDWDDWQDPDYIAEQQKALEEFAKKQREIKANMGAKKKKKKTKKKKKGQTGETGGEALDLDAESAAPSQLLPGGGSDDGSEYVSRVEESKLGGMNGTRFGEQSVDNFNSNFDATSMEDESRFGVGEIIGGAKLDKMLKDQKAKGRTEAAIGY